MKASPVRDELDSIVVNIELTLASIIQGVALYFLTDNARGLLSVRNGTAAIYAACGLAIVFIFWSRSIIHTLTLIRWPIEFGHNFFYLGCALGEAVLFSHLADPRGWFTLSAIYAVFVWLLFVYDIKLLNARVRECNGEAARELYAVVERDQRRNIFILLPSLIALNAGCAAMLRLAPHLFADHNRHVWLAATQLVAFIGYLFYVTRFWRKIAPLVVRSREEHCAQRD